jgi:hypothetical protein
MKTTATVVILPNTHVGRGNKKLTHVCAVHLKFACCFFGHFGDIRYCPASTPSDTPAQTPCCAVNLRCSCISTVLSQIQLSQIYLLLDLLVGFPSLRKFFKWCCLYRKTSDIENRTQGPGDRREIKIDCCTYQLNKTYPETWITWPPCCEVDLYQNVVNF